MSQTAIPQPQTMVPEAPREELRGLVLVAAAAIVWSFGGTIARFIEAPDPWTSVFYRSLFASAFLLGFLLWRDGAAGTVRLFRAMGLPGIAVGLCFATASTSFVIALQHTTVANILLLQAGVPLIAALIGWILFRERVRPATWAAIALVIFGVFVMVSDSVSGKVSPVGDGLAILIAFAFSVATVVTRRFAHVRMTPAVCFGTTVAMVIAATQTSTFAVTGSDLGFLILFGAANLGLGLAFFVTGARMVAPAAAALISTLETMLGPLWVWLVHNEVPLPRTIIGGTIILLALVAHIVWQMKQSRKVLPPQPSP